MHWKVQNIILLLTDSFRKKFFVFDNSWSLPCSCYEQCSLSTFRVSSFHALFPRRVEVGVSRTHRLMMLNHGKSKTRKWSIAQCLWISPASAFLAPSLKRCLEKDPALELLMNIHFGSWYLWCMHRNWVSGFRLRIWATKKWKRICFRIRQHYQHRSQMFLRNNDQWPSQWLWGWEWYR